MTLGASRLGLLLFASLLAAACDETPLQGLTSADAAPEASAKAAPEAPEGRVAEILSAEHRRVASAITEADQASGDVLVRRAAARALSRIGGEGAHAGLLRALGDEDDEVASWGAYGLGFFCRTFDPDKTVSSLVAAAIARFEGDAPQKASIDAYAAFARAIGRCAADTSEPTLVAWLAGPRERAIAASFALGDVGGARQKLREDTIVALLARAAGSASVEPLPEALDPIGRIEHVPPTVVDRVREVATARLTEAGPSRIFAVRALSRGGEDAATELSRVLTSTSAFSAAERAEAVKGLKRLDRAGQEALAGAVGPLSPPTDPLAATSLVSEDLGVLLATLEALKAPGRAKKDLQALAEKAPPKGAPAAILRRFSWMRCTAAKVLAGKNEKLAALAACDVSPSDEAPKGEGDAGAADGASLGGAIGQRAMVEVLGRAPITGGRLATWRAYAERGDLRAREAAIELLASHDEIVGAAEVLAAALADKRTGLVATAADVIAKHPYRAREEPKQPRSRKKKKADKDDGATLTLTPSSVVVEAISKALSSPAASEDLEMQSALIDAAAALGMTEALPRIEAACGSSQPTTREHAASAIAILKGKKPVCDAPEAGGGAPVELSQIVSAPTILTFDTDAGEMSITLDPNVAPVVATRVAALARKGYYDGNVVHRIVPGFVTQFGAPDGDGYGGPALPPVRCETSPRSFEALTVGIALAGRDTGSSQLFVMHAHVPRLDGQYAWVGTAKGPWAALIDGDQIRKVTVAP